MNEDPLAMILDYIRMVFHVDLIKFNWMLKEVKLHLKDAELFICLLYTSYQGGKGKPRRDDRLY